MTKTGTPRRSATGRNDESLPPGVWDDDVEIIDDAQETPAPTGSEPAWRSRFLVAEWDRTLCWAAVLAALIVLAVGHRRLAASPSNSEQVAFLISGGFAAILVLTTAVTLLVVAALRDTEHKVARIAGADGRTDDPVPPQMIWVVPAAVVWLAGGALVVAGYRRAGGTIDLSSALTGLPMAGGGLALSSASVIGYTAARRIRLARTIRTVVHGLHRLESLTAGQPSNVIPLPEPSPSGDQPVPGGRWTASGLRHYHQRSCAALLHAGGDVVAATADGLDPCLLCSCEDVMHRA